jgi:hypothetical protein
VHVAGEPLRVQPVDLQLARGRRLGQDGQPPRAEVDPARPGAAGRGPGDPVEPVAAQNEAAPHLLAAGHDHRLVGEPDRLGGDAEPDLTPGRAQRVDKVTDQQLLRIHVVRRAAQRRVVEDVPPSGTAEFARADGLAPRQHPAGQAVALEQPAGAVLDQARPGAGPDGVLGQALEDNTVDARPDQNAGCEQPRRPRSHNAHIAHD